MQGLRRQIFLVALRWQLFDFDWHVVLQLVPGIAVGCLRVAAKFVVVGLLDRGRLGAVRHVRARACERARANERPAVRAQALSLVVLRAHEKNDMGTRSLHKTKGVPLQEGE